MVIITAIFFTPRVPRDDDGDNTLFSNDEVIMRFLRPSECAIISGSVEMKMQGR